MKTTADHSTTTHSRSAHQPESSQPFFSHDEDWGGAATAEAEPFFQPKSDPSLTNGMTDTSSSFFSPHVTQPKLKVGAPNDKYEQEADNVADQ
ncbi:MAG: hypothetical protein AAFU67_09300, partial [Bacteroidota bacterium]